MHYIASFGLTLAVVPALRAHSRSFTEGTFPTFAILYAATTGLAFATFFLSVLRAPRDKVRGRFRTLRWILAAQLPIT